MGYEKEIILFKKEEYLDFSGLEFLEMLEDSSWNATLAIIDRGDNFDWIDSKNNIEFEQILRDKTKMKEYIGFTLKSEMNDRFVTVNIDNDRFIFTLDIGRNENELELFEWFYENLILQANGLVEKSSRIEWRSNYDNEVIKLIENKSI